MVKIRKLAGKPVQNGFSLLEMLVVVGIILILATVAVPKFMSAGKTAKIAKISADIRTIDNAAALYEIDKGKYPDSVAALAEKDSDGKAYLQFEPKLPDGLPAKPAVPLSTRRKGQTGPALKRYMS